MPALLIYLTLDHIVRKLPCALLHCWAKELRRSNCHDRNGQLRLGQLAVDLSILESRTVRLQNSAIAAWLLDAFNPMIESLGLDESWIVAFLLDEHLPEFSFVAGYEHFWDVRDVEEGKVLGFVSRRHESRGIMIDLPNTRLPSCCTVLKPARASTALTPPSQVQKAASHRRRA